MNDDLQKENINARLKYAVTIALFIVYTFLFYGPLSLYLPNSEEIWFGLGTLMRVILPVSLVGIVLIILPLILLPDSIASVLRKIAFGLGLALYVQGNWLGMNYGSGVLDGSEIQWDDYRTYGTINSLIWIICILIPFIISIVVRKIKDSVNADTVMVVVSLFLIAVQIPAMAIQLTSYKPNASAKLAVSTEDMYELSHEDNIIYIIFDAMDEEYYNSYMRSHPEYEKELEGFVHYENTLASGARTLIAIPSMFTGQPFTRQDTYSAYLDEIWGGDNAFTALNKGGYSVRIYAPSTMYSEKMVDYIDNFSIDDGSHVGSYKTLLKKVYKLDLFKFLPHVLKRKCMFNTAEFTAAKDTTNTFRSGDPKFYEGFREKGFSVNRSLDKTFILYHLVGAHVPYNLTAEATFIKDGNLEDQVVGCFTGLKEILDDLKAKGLYDSSTIIVSADHGDVNVFECPLLLIKEKDSHKAYSTSSVPASLFDIPILLSGLAGEELSDQTYGMNIYELQEGQQRERHFFRNDTDNTKIYIREFVSHGDTKDRNNIEEVNTYEDSDDINTPYTLGTELSFTADATGNKYCVEGFSYRQGFRTAIIGRKAVLSMPIPDVSGKESLSVSIALHHDSNESGPLEIFAGGEKIYEVEANKDLIKKGLEFKVPVSSMTDEGWLTLEFVFTDIPEGSNAWALSFSSMVIN